MSFIPSIAQDAFVFDYREVKELGKDLTQKYNTAEPFPHVVIDNFLPESVARYCVEHFPKKLDQEGQEFNRAQERFKRSFHPDYLEPRLRTLFYAFNSRPFIKVVENITGINGLIPDPYYLGAGFHEILQGGHLSMHADFNHHKPLNLERRVNLLVYLNDDWKAEYGGQLDLWTSDMSRCVQSIVPLFNRCALFTTTGESMHGNPTPIQHPAGVSRKSIALYYYTSTWDPTRVGKTTQFRVRPGTSDKHDWLVRADEFFSEYAPPVLSRKVTNLRYRLTK